MNNQSKSMNSKAGGVLVMAMVVLLTFSVLAIGLFKLHETDAVETVYMGHSKQAFWLAENGLQDAIQRLRYDSAFRSSAAGGSNSFLVTNETERTSYEVTVTDNGTGNPAIDYYEFDVVSVGRKGGMNRQIRQFIATRPGLESTIWGGRSHHCSAKHATHEADYSNAGRNTYTG